MKTLKQIKIASWHAHIYDYGQLIKNVEKIPQNKMIHFYAYEIMGKIQIVLQPVL